MTNLANSNRSMRLATWPAVAVVLLIAFFFRFYRLADHPLGIFFDPAINGLDAVRLMQRGGHVLFFPTNGGRESLFMYLLIPFIWLFDTTPLSIRALTATISLLTVACLIAFLKDLRFTIYDLRFTTYDLRGIDRRFAGKDDRRSLSFDSLNSWLALLAGLVLATSYWHISVSRLGQRPVLVPALAVPMFWFFLKGWHSKERRWFILSGILMGLEGYTYSAARLLPLILTLAVLPEFVLKSTVRSRSNQLLSAIGLFLATTLLVYGPMAWYLFSHPAQFTARAFSVMIWNFLDTPGEIALEIGRNLLRVAGFFCCAGSPNPIFGLPDHPGLPLLLTPFLLIGLFVAVRRWRDLFHRLVVLWWLLGILPSIIAIEAPHPLRMIVAIPPTAILVALGLLQLTAELLHKTSATRSAFRFTAYALPILLILLSLPRLFQAYFVDWTKLETTQGIYDYGAIAIRDTILDYADSNIPIYLPQSRINDSTLLFYLSGAFEREARLSTTPAEAAIIIASDKNVDDRQWVRLFNGTATILPPLEIEGRRLIQSALSGDDTILIRAANNETIARLARLATDPVRYAAQPTHAADAAFGPVELMGAVYPAVINPDAGLPVTLYWTAKRPMSDEYEILLRLVDDNRQAVGHGDARPNDLAYPTSFWRPNLDEIASDHTVAIETEPLKPGRYWLALSVYDPASGQRLPLTSDVSDSPNTLFLGPLKVPIPPAPSADAVTLSLDTQAKFGDDIQLVGYEIDDQTVTPGEPLELHLLWQAVGPPEADYTVFVHLLDTDGQLVAGHDAQPLAGQYPTSIWTRGEQIPDTHVLPIPADLPDGHYRLAIGLYFQPTGKRLPIYLEQTRLEDGRLILPHILLSQK